MSNNRKIPSYRLHKPSVQAVVTLNGRDFYLGAYATDVSRREYDRLIAEWLGHGRVVPCDPAVSINEIVLGYWEHVQAYYRKNGHPTDETAAVRSALRPLAALYGEQPASDFGPLKLKAVRQKFIDAGLARKTVNGNVGRIKRMFKWAVAEELVPAAIRQALAAVNGLRRGRCTAREPEPVRPVPREHVEAVLPHLSRQVATMVRLQMRTGMRSGEVLRLRAADLDMSGPIWVYTPAEHKTEHRSIRRRFYLGPKAQQELRPSLTSSLDVYLFSSKQAVSERSARLASERKTPLTPSQRSRNLRRRFRRRQQPDRCYGPDSYRVAIMRACKRAGVPNWHPHQLRHTLATEIRGRFGLEAARVLLGHTTPLVTKTYALRDEAAALRGRFRGGLNRRPYL